MPFFQGGVDTTKPSARVHKTLEELQLWKRQLVAASERLVVYTKGTCELAAVLDRPLYAFPRVYDWAPDNPAATQAQAPTAVLKSVYEKQLGPSDKMSQAPSNDVMVELQRALSRDVHKPIKEWHDRYKVLRKGVNVELENSRKKFDASSADLTKALKAQEKERKREHASAVEQMQMSVNVKSEARRDLWARYCEDESRIHALAEALARDARQASNHLTRAAAAVAAAMSDLAQRFASTSNDKAGGSGGAGGLPQVAQAMQRMSLNSAPSSRHVSADGEQAMYNQGAGGVQQGWPHSDPSATMASAASGNFSDSYAESSHVSYSGGRYGASPEVGQPTPGREPWSDCHSAAGSGLHSRHSSGSSSASQGLLDAAAPSPALADGYVPIGVYGVPHSPAAGHHSAARSPGQQPAAAAMWWNQQPVQAGSSGGTMGKGTWVGGGPSSGMGYIRPDLRTSGHSDASDVSLAAAAGGVPSPTGPYGLNGTTRIVLPHTPESVASSTDLGDEETPAAEKGLTSPFMRQFR